MATVNIVGRAEVGEYGYATIGDRGETVQLATYGKLFSITRQAIINDDLSAFTRIPMNMARAAKRTLAKFVLDFVRAATGQLAITIDDVTGAGGTTRVVTDQDLYRLRVKLKLGPENGYTLVPVYNYGYRLEQLKASE